ncbi:DNA methyltransferase [Pseudomonas qingdaonensis]|uniref:DNA methyltransferase n=1 Tax=Pseudomonas qingdaonensis TaxID=2056231 RepID=UPI00265DEB27|nr:DNA methyltransferase [Pseudomonas qingdaonensis]WKL68396.1 DNA methyltransferase [Pseudomonas qingdaonensis]
MSDLFQNHAANSGPVECLGQTFPSDEARREHYLKLLAEKLKDPAFRKIEGFPIGSDETILELSDPPYYTACPNPFLRDFVKSYGSEYKTGIEICHVEPFTADVSEGKNDPIYNAHSYHTKVPHKAIMRYLLHYTQPGELVLDSFCGTGMTGVAAQLCGDRRAVESLGYTVDDKGIVFDRVNESGKTELRAISKIGPRIPVLNDLSTIGGFIAYNFNSSVDTHDLESATVEISKALQKNYGWMYQTLHQPTDHQLDSALQLVEHNSLPDLSGAGLCARINYTVWSDVFSCPECAHEIVFFDVALDHENGGVRDDLACPSCSARFGKKELGRAWETKIDTALSQNTKQAKQVPVLINYSVGRQRHEKRPDKVDLALITKISGVEIKDKYPTTRMSEGAETRRNDPIGVTHVHHFYTHRNLIALSALRSMCAGPLGRQLLFGFTSTHQFVNRLCRLNVSNYFSGKGGKVDKPLDGTLYAPSISLELNVIEKWSLRSNMDKVLRNHKNKYVVSTGSAFSMDVPPDSLDYIFIDPPFGGNLMYSELNFLWESWLRATTNNLSEAIQSKDQGKSIDDYRRLMSAGFSEAYRILKPGRWMTVEFSNTQASVWNAIQTALQEAGFVVANVSAIDKKKGSFKAVTTTTAVKQDLIISAYKPNGGLEDRFAANLNSEESAWDFVRTHLGYLPIVKFRVGELEFIVERDPRIIFDRMVAWFVRHNTPVPMSSHEFQSGLMQRFVERDGMVFLPDQVAEYDKKRLQVAVAPQMEMFVSDERSAIDWLSDFLKRRPSTYQEVSPEFMGQLGAGWKKYETKPELSALLGMV